MSITAASAVLRLTDSAHRRQLVCHAQSSDSPEDFPTPKATPRRTGFEWLKRAPRIRYRRPENRCPDQLLDLAVVNERLLGSSPWEVRRKVEYLKKRQYNWDMVYEIIVRREAGATLKELEDASRNVEAVLSKDSKDSKSVVELKRELVELQKEVQSAHEKLHVTQSRVLQNLNRIQNLKKQLELNQAELGADATVDDGALNADVRSMHGDVMNAWYPVQFSSRLSKRDVLLPFELFGEPWLLFRDASNNPACIQDECAHRACPLSIGKIVDGHVACPYHGWEYNKEGRCVKMPSTVFRKDISIRSLPVSEKDGFLWVWPGEVTPPGNEIPIFSEVPSNFVTLAENETIVQIDKTLLLSNLLDEECIPFSSLLRPWFGSIPIERRMNTVDLTFEPPCSVVSLVDVAKSRRSRKRKHVHQLHICLPISEDKVRVLHRVCLDFWKWASLPIMRKFFSSFAEKALAEDLLLASRQLI